MPAKTDTIKIELSNVLYITFFGAVSPLGIGTKKGRNAISQIVYVSQYSGKTAIRSTKRIKVKGTPTFLKSRKL